MDPIVSFIVPVYNGEKYLKECIDSLLSQTVKELEVIIVDDGSTDSSGKIAENFAEADARVHMLHQENSGVSVARNKGMEIASGEWLCFVDADDILHKCYIETLMVYQKYDVVFSGYSEFYDFCQEAKSLYKETELYNKEDFKYIRKIGLNRDLANGKYKLLKISTPWAKLFKRNIIRENGLHFPKGIVTGEDLLFNLQYFELCENGIMIKDALYYHRVHDKAVSRAFSASAVKDYKNLLNKLQEYCSEQSVDLSKEMKEKIVISLGFITILNFAHKDNPKSYKLRKADFFRCTDEEIFKNALDSVDVKRFSFRKKILVLLLKKRLFAGICLFNSLNQMIEKLKGKLRK